MIIDAHTHLGKKTIVATARDLVASMDAAGIDISMVFAGKLTSLPTDELLKDIEPYKDRLKPVGSVSPLDGTYTSLAKMVEHLKAGAIHAVKFYPGYEHYYPSQDIVRPYLAALQEHGKPAIFHSGDTFSGVHSSKLKYAKPLDIDDIAVDFPNLKIVIAHMGYPWHNDAAEVVYKNENVYVDCSGFVYGKFDNQTESHFREVLSHYLKVAGTDERLMFGTDWPISDQQSYVTIVSRIFRSDAVLEKVFSGTACKLFGIEVPKK